ncbi:transposase [Paenibacillus sp. LHD-38]|nr:transposase [Paenibacillus sp. LHD-38]MDQ8737129.1 transposase [Paenibacillus sp. LHD-38]
MNLGITEDLHFFSQELTRHLSPSSLADLAKAIGFVTRSSKFRAQDLVALCVWLSQHTRVYQKNEHPETFRNGIVKKQSEYIQLSMESIMEKLQLGETREISDVYIGMYQKLPARLVVYRLSEIQMRKREKDQAVREKKKGMTYSEKSKKLSALNFYITNISSEIVPGTHLHELYSLRWQVEILFKTWKSFFQIQQCKKMKLERLECHLYGQLIGILLCSTTMFQIRQLLWRKKKELSEYKAFYMIKDYMLLLHQAIQKDTEEISKVLLRLFHLIEKNGRKSHRYEKKTVFDILGVVYEYTTSRKRVA